MEIEPMNGIPLNSWGRCSKKGWITKELFIELFKKFVKSSCTNKDDPVVLLLDGYVTYVKRIEQIGYVNNNGVVLLCFPPHCTYRLQSLDAALSTY